MHLPFFIVCTTVESIILMVYNEYEVMVMAYQIRTARLEDLDRILEIYSLARVFMAEHGNPDQWGSTYPPVEMVREDIQNQLLFIIVSDECIHGVFYFYIGEDPCYHEIFQGFWRSDTIYGTIHRIAGDGSGGILKAAVEFGKARIAHLRIDTHSDNVVMQNAIAKQGFSQRGIVFMEDGTPRIAYDYLAE